MKLAGPEDTHEELLTELHRTVKDNARTAPLIQFIVLTRGKRVIDVLKEVERCVAAFVESER